MMTFTSAGWLELAVVALVVISVLEYLLRTMR